MPLRHRQYSLSWVRQPSAPPPRLKILLFHQYPGLPTARPLHNTRVTPQSTSPTTSRSHVQIEHCKCKHRCVSLDDTASRISIKARMTCNRQRLQRGSGSAQTNLLLWRRSAAACLSPCTWTNADVTLKWCVKVMGECNREVWCTTVEQKSPSPPTVTKHSEVQNLFS